MKAFAAGVAVMGLCVVCIAIMTAPSGRSQTMSTIGLAIDGARTLQLERDAQAFQLRLAEIDAAQARARAEENTIRLIVIVGALVLIALATAAGMIASRLPRRVTHVLMLPDGTRHAIDEIPGEWHVIHEPAALAAMRTERRQ